jgi:hypothetical protein
MVCVPCLNVSIYNSKINEPTSGRRTRLVTLILAQVVTKFPTSCWIQWPYRGRLGDFMWWLYVLQSSSLGQRAACYVLTDVSVKPGVRGSWCPRRSVITKNLTRVITQNTLPCPPGLAFGIHPEPGSVQSVSFTSYLFRIHSVLTFRVSLRLQSGLFLPRLRGHTYHLPFVCITQATGPIHLIITNFLWREQQVKLLFTQPSHPAITTPPLGTDVLFRTLTHAMNLGCYSIMFQ